MVGFVYHERRIAGDPRGNPSCSPHSVTRVDRKKHDFDVLEHVLRGVHASTADDLLRGTADLSPALDEFDAPEVWIVVREPDEDPEEG